MWPLFQQRIPAASVFEVVESLQGRGQQLHLARTHRPSGADVVSALVPSPDGAVPRADSFLWLLLLLLFFFFSTLIRRLASVTRGVLGAVCVGLLGVPVPRGDTRTVWGQGQAAQPARGDSPERGLSASERKPINVWEWKWPWGKSWRGRGGRCCCCLSVCLSLRNLGAPGRGYCAVELLLDGVQAAKWGRSSSSSPGWVNSSVGCDFWGVPEAGELGDGVGSSGQQSLGMWAAPGRAVRDTTKKDFTNKKIKNKEV